MLLSYFMTWSTFLICWYSRGLKNERSITPDSTFTGGRSHRWRKKWLKYPFTRRENYLIWNFSLVCARLRACKFIHIIYLVNNCIILYYYFGIPIILCIYIYVTLRIRHELLCLAHDCDWSVNSMGEGESETVVGVMTDYECAMKCKELAESNLKINGATVIKTNQTCVCNEGMSTQLKSFDHNSCYLPGKDIKK